MKLGWQETKSGYWRAFSDGFSDSDPVAFVDFRDGKQVAYIDFAAARTYGFRSGFKDAEAAKKFVDQCWENLP